MNKKIPGKVWTHLIGNQPITIQLKFPSQRYYKNLGTSVNFSPMSPPSMFTCVANMDCIIAIQSVAAIVWENVFN